MSDVLDDVAKAHGAKQSAPDPESHHAYVSYSRISTLFECPQKWALQYMFRDIVEPIPMWAGVGGTAFHSATEILDLSGDWALNGDADE